MLESLNFEIAGETLQLLSDRAVFWPARQRLLIADLHLGKGNTFRAAGIGIPTGGTAHDLQRLDALLQFTHAQSLWVLGDMLHANHHGDVDAQWRKFRARFAHVDVAVLPGNHDRQLETERLQMERLPDDLHDGPFVFSHAPARTGSNDAHTISGHVHPLVHLPGVGRLPVFWIGATQTVLPAFSAFTGGYVIPYTEIPNCVACNGSSLVSFGP